MSRPMIYKIYNEAGYLMGAAVFQEDAANWASTLGPGSTVRYGKTILYTIPADGEPINFNFMDSFESATTETTPCNTTPK